MMESPKEMGRRAPGRGGPLSMSLDQKPMTAVTLIVRGAPIWTNGGAL